MPNNGQVTRVSVSSGTLGNKQSYTASQLAKPWRNRQRCLPSRSHLQASVALDRGQMPENNIKITARSKKELQRLHYPAH